MSYYYKYNFVSPEPLYARVQEEMRSYFSTGAIDTVMFPLWTDDCIRKFQKTYYPIKPAVLCISGGKAELPEDFKQVREAWVCTTTYSNPAVTKGSYYYQQDYNITVRDVPVDVTNQCTADSYTITRKITGQTVNVFQHSHLLYEGDPCYAANQFKIEDGCMITSFSEGTVHLVYYSDGLGEDGYQMIPDNFFFQDYIRKYLMYMLFRQLFNQTTDETFNQMQMKLKMAESDMLRALTIAEIDSKKETRERRVHRVKKAINRNNRYNIR